MQRKREFDDQTNSSDKSEERPGRLNRREFVTGAGLTSLAAATSPFSVLADEGIPVPPDGTPEQIHLTFGDDPSSTVVVSWVTVAQAVNPRVVVDEHSGHKRTVHAVQRAYTDGLNGQTVFTYHAKIEGLKPQATVNYVISADNDRNHARPFEGSFKTAPRGRAAFRWTSYGDLATPETRWNLSSPQSQFAVQAVESFAPLFHLLNGDLCYANLNHEAQPAVWADFGYNVQLSAAHRPWMPCPGNHEIEFGNGPTGHNSYLTRYSLPRNGTPFQGLWYCFQVGADALEDAIWSARRDTDTGYGIGVFDLDPGKPGGTTSITVRYYHASGADKVPTSKYELFETIVPEKDRHDSFSLGPLGRGARNR